MWPFEAALPAAYSRPPGTLDAFWARAHACKAAAEAAGFVYELVDMRTAELSAVCYSGRLTPRARELLAGLNLLYLRGGVFVSLWEDCRRPGGRDLALASLLPPAAADPAATALPLVLDSLKDVWQVGAPTHHFACISATSACAVAAATQYSHGSFQLLAALTRALVSRDPSHFDNARFGETPVAELWSRFAGALEDVEASARALSPASLRELIREYAVPLDDLTMVRGADAGAVERAVAPPPRPLFVAVYGMWGAECNAAGVLSELRGILAPVLWLALGRPLEPVDCFFTPLNEQLDAADVILFGPFGNRTRSGEVARRHAGRAITVFIGSENQWQGDYHDHMVPDVHVSLSYSRDIDAGNYLRLPWWLPYSLDAAILLTDTPRFSPLLRRLPAEEDGDAWAARPRPAALLSRRYSFPLPELFSLLTGAGHAVDAPSTAFHNIEWPVGLPNSHLDGKIDFLRSYRFNICPENSKTGGRGGYSTEKLAQALMAGTVPIYWGDPLDDEVFNPARVILFNGTDGVPVLETIRRLEEDAQFRQNWFASPILAAGADKWLGAWVTRAAGLFQLAAPVLRAD